MALHDEIDETISGVLIMKQPELELILIPYLRYKCRAQRIVIAIEKGFAVEFLELSTIYLNRDLEKLELFPLLSKVDVDIINLSSGGKQFCDMRKANIISCPRCYCFTTVTDKQIIQCMGCFEEPLQERITGEWTLKNIKEYACPFIPAPAKELTFVQQSKTIVYETFFNTPFYDELSSLDIGQRVWLTGWIDKVTLEPARYFIYVKPL